MIEGNAVINLARVLVNYKLPCLKATHTVDLNQRKKLIVIC